MPKWVYISCIAILLFITGWVKNGVAAVYNVTPDTLFLSADTGTVTYQGIKIWNGGAPSDSIVVDSVKFISTSNDSALPFFIRDSMGGVIPDSIGQVIRWAAGSFDTLRLQVEFKPTSAGQFGDSLIITYKFGIDSAKITDTVAVKGTGTEPPPPMTYNSMPDTLILMATTGMSVIQYVKIWNGKMLADTVIVDSVKFKSTHNDTALPFIVHDSLGNVFADSIGKVLLGQTGDSLKLRVLFKPTTTGQFRDSLIITFKFGKDSIKLQDTIVVKGTGNAPPPMKYNSIPDTVYLTSETGKSDSQYVKIWNGLTFMDTVIVDSVKFKSTHNDTAFPFIVCDSLGNVFADSIGKVLLGQTGDSLKLRVLFKPTMIGVFGDSLIITYKFWKADSIKKRDTIIVKGTGNAPPFRYNSKPDTVFLTANTGMADTQFVQIWNGGMITDTVIVDSVKFKSTHNDTALPFIVRDSLANVFPDSIGIVLRGQTNDSLKLRVLFKPTVAGLFSDSLIITFKFGKDSIKLRDTILVQGTGNAPIYNSMPDSVILSANIGSPAFYPMKIWNSGTVTDSIVIDSVKFISTYKDTALPFIALDSFGIKLPDSIGRIVQGQPGDTLELIVKFNPISVGQFNDKLLITYSFSKDGPNFKDTVFVKGMGNYPYNSKPDSVFLMADTAFADSQFVKIWNSGAIFDSIIVDSVKFKSTHSDTALPFIVHDSIGNVISDSIGMVIRGTTDDTLRLGIRFKPTLFGQFKDSLIITFSFTKNGPNYRDTIFVKGMGNIPSSKWYSSKPDTVILSSDISFSDSQYVKIWNNGPLADSIVVDSVKFFSTFNDTALPFIVRDSMGVVMPDSIGRVIRGIPADTMRIRVLFKPTSVGTFNDMLFITYSFGKNGPNFRDTVYVKGSGVAKYHSIPDTVMLTANVSEKDTQYVKIWNGGTLSDSVVVDSVKFFTTFNDSAIPFIVLDSIGNVMPDSIGRVVKGQLGDTLKLRVLFIPTTTGSVTNKLIITYSLSKNGPNFKDTILVKGKGKLRFGDVNKDKSINAADASPVLQYVIGIPSAIAYFSSDSLLPDIADVSNNGTVTAYDAALILRRSVDIISSFPADTTQFLKVLPSEFEKLYLAAPISTSKETSIIRVPLKIQKGKGIYALDGNLKYDPEFLEFHTMEVKFSKDNIISDAAAKDGELKFAIASGVPLILDGEIVVFTFRIKQPSVNSISITMPEISVNEQSVILGSATVEMSSIPDHFYLSQNFPNPFNPVTVIQFALPEQAYVNLEIFNIIGQRVRTLVRTQMPAGYHRFEWNGRNDAGQPVSSGIYIYSLRTNKFTAVRKMTFLK